ncbi:unnamed protein product [marine sediment metagenome]|uniref:Uncharacterized protein n=1 Tax=marine sediment metagenome TaxID=412755 RepID=X0VVH1_9ZZZZ
MSDKMLVEFTEGTYYAWGKAVKAYADGRVVIRVDGITEEKN